MTKKVLIIILSVVALAVSAWFILSREEKPSDTSTTLDNVLPFGSGDGQSTTGVVGGSGGGSDAGTPNKNSYLFKLSDVPVSGAVAFNKSGSLNVRYVERATGHIVDINPISLAKIKIVNTTVPKVYEAVWKSDGSTVIFRTLRDNETIESTSYSLIPPSGTSTSDLYTTKSTGLPANISNIDIGDQKIFYTIKNQPQVVAANLDGTKAATIFSLSFNQWNMSAVGDISVVMTTKPTFTAGFSYQLNTKSGAITKLLGPLNGLLVQPNKNMSSAAFSYIDSDGGTNFAAYTKSDPKSAIRLTPTLADKCVWSNKTSSMLYCGVPSDGVRDNEPTSWYQGTTHYTDDIWVFNLDAGYSNVISDPKKEFGVSIDAEKLFLSPDEDYLFFTNKNDLTLWALKLVD